MTLDLDAIRARDAAMPFNDPQSEWDSHARAAWDRRALLAEVDWLQRLYAAGLNETLGAKARADILADAMVDRNIDRWDRGVEHERARALPVIEAARAVMREHGEGYWSVPTMDALRAALAEYDR